MGWRWRKTAGRGPIRISLSKKGIGWSVGVPGLRVGRSPDGRTYVSQGIPGTGLYRIKYFGGAKNRQPTAPQTPGLPAPAPRAPMPAPHQPQPAPRRTPAPVQGQAPAPNPPAAPRAVKAAGGFMGAVTRFFDRLF
jgi:hypothetical protein